MSGVGDVWDSLFEHFPDMVCVANFVGGLIRVNRACSEVIGYPSEELLAMNYLDLIHPEDRAWVREKLLSLAEGRVLSDVEFRILRADGSYRWSTWSGRGDMARQRIYATGRDTHERHEFDERVLRSQRMDAIGQLAGGIAHDFNNLLQAILSNTDVLAHELQGEPTLQRVREIDAAATRAAELTQRLLSFARRQPLQRRRIDVQELIESTAEILERLMPDNVELVCRGLNASLAIAGDRAAIEQVVMNLCLNARDAMPDGGRLTIECGEREIDAEGAAELDVAPGSYVHIAVRDTGLGISAEIAPHLFEPFFTTKQPGSGTGLGLAMSFGIVRQHGGIIEVDSSPGSGSLFEVLLPQARVDVLEPAEPGALETTGGDERLLVVEDDPLVRSAARAILERAGYTVMVASDGAEALGVFGERDDIDGVVLDVMMPRLSGPEALRALRRGRPWLPAVLITGYADPRVLGSDPGAEVIVKPFTAEALLTAVRAALDRDSSAAAS